MTHIVRLLTVGLTVVVSCLVRAVIFLYYATVSRITLASMQLLVSLGVK
jgi:hypothetical protein